jgi:hypothetical protein
MRENPEGVTLAIVDVGKDDFTRNAGSAQRSSVKSCSAGAPALPLRQTLLLQRGISG